MKLQPSHAIIAVMGLIIAVLAWALIYFSRDELGTQAKGHEDVVKTVAMAGEDDGRPVVKLTAQSQKAAGIVLAPLDSMRREAGLEAYGIVVNLQPLTELRGRYLAAMAEAAAARISASAAESEAARMDALFRDDRNVSEQAAKAAHARYQAELARKVSAEQAVASLRDAMRGAWGEAVTAWATNPDSHKMRALQQQSASLVQMVFPYDHARVAHRETISIAPTMARGNARTASYVGDSPQVDPAYPGDTVFYLVNGGGLRSGMRVAAHVRTGGAPVEGFVVPSAAVVWHAGKAWAYVKEDDGQSFERHEVATTDEVEGGWFNATGFDDDDAVVISGAQLLLSEELKYQIRNENED
ncbi:MAG TPA: hypothetical protein VHB46_19765 [Burkholderiales bacterium]|nr:hypothetical protein [Burkholderiales bacterium]